MFLLKIKETLESINKKIKIPYNLLSTSIFVFFIDEDQAVHAVLYPVSFAQKCLGPFPV